MDLFDAMRTAFACREFTDEPVTDEQLHRILDTARFAPSGGNRQGAHVVVVRDRDLRQRLGELAGPPLRLYAAQAAAGETPFNSGVPSHVDPAAALAAVAAGALLVDVRSATEYEARHIAAAVSLPIGAALDA